MNVRPFADSVDELYIQNRLPLVVDALISWSYSGRVERHNHRRVMARDLLLGSRSHIAVVDDKLSSVLRADMRHDFAAYAVSWLNLLYERPFNYTGSAYSLSELMYDWDANSITLRNQEDRANTYITVEEDLWCGIAVQLLYRPENVSSEFSIKDNATLLLLKLLEQRMNGVGQWLSGFFLSAHLLDIATPERSPMWNQSQRLQAAIRALWCLHDPYRHIGSPLTLLQRALESENPWVITHPPIGQQRPSVLGATVPPPRKLSMRTALEAITLGTTEDNHVEIDGRVQYIRHQGRITFITLASLERWVGSIQMIVEKGESAADYAQIVSNIKPFDRVRVVGKLTVSRTGEPSIIAEQVVWLSQNLLTLTNAQQLYRRSQLASSVSKILASTREVLQEHEFQEVYTPIAHRSFSGGASQPFKTYRRADERNLYLRGTFELTHKQLIAGDIPRLYEIGSTFRNEGKDRFHLPEFLMLEAYAAYQDLQWIEQLAVAIVQRCWTAVRVDPVPPVETITVPEALNKYLNIDLTDPTRACIKIGNVLGQAVDISDMKAAIDRVVNGVLHRYLPNIHIVRGISTDTTPFARQGDNTRSWLYVRSIGFTDICVEETSAAVVEHALSVQAAQLGWTVHRNDTDLLKALLVGMPPTVGLGMSLARLVQLLLDLDDIRTTEWWDIDL